MKSVVLLQEFVLEVINMITLVCRWLMHVFFSEDDHVMFHREGMYDLGISLFINFCNVSAPARYFPDFLLKHYLHCSPQITFGCLVRRQGNHFEFFCFRLSVGKLRSRL